MGCFTLKLQFLSSKNEKKRLQEVSSFLPNLVTQE